jgi:hypothetical protein
VSQNLEVAWNVMPIFVRRDRQIDWRIWDARTKADVGAAEIVMRDPVFRNNV